MAVAVAFALAVALVTRVTVVPVLVEPELELEPVLLDAVELLVPVELVGQVPVLVLVVGTGVPFWAARSAWSWVWSALRVAWSVVIGWPSVWSLAWAA